MEDLEREDFRLLAEKHELVLAGSLTLHDARVLRLRSLFEFCGESLTESALRDLAARRMTVYKNSRRAAPGAIPLLECLRAEVRIAVVTNNLASEQRDKLSACGLDSLIDELITSEEVGAAKPSREIFRAALDRLECQPIDAVMVGDSWTVDVVGAMNAGIRPVWFNRTGESQPSGFSVAEIRSLEPANEVAAILRSPERFSPVPQSHL